MPGCFVPKQTLLIVLVLPWLGLTCWLEQASALRPLSDPEKPRRQAVPRYFPEGNATLEVPEQDAGPKAAPPLQVYVRAVRVEGCTAFSPERIRALTEPYTDRFLATEDLEQLRIELTKLYQQEGYVNSGAVVPDQKVQNATIRLQAVEGELTEIEILEDTWFREAYLEARIRVAVDRPLSIHDLQKGLQMLQQKEQVERIRARLKPGLKPGRSILELEVAEKKPFSLEVQADNHQSPSVGGESLELTLDSQNLSGWGDALSLTYGRSEGLDPKVDAWYSLPLTARDLTASVRYRQNDFSVIEAPFEDLDVESESEAVAAGLRLPLYRDLEQELALGLELEYQENETSLLGEPFSFSAGAEEGRTQVTALRLHQEWTRRTTRQVLALSSRFSLGLDLFGATVHSDRPDGRFLAWLGQGQWARVLGDSDIQALARLDVQLASEALLPLEQVAVGGRYSVRGYRENELVRDNGISASIEARIPIVQDARLADALFLAPFADYGRSWNEDRPTLSPRDLYSVGAGLIWDWTPLPGTPELESHVEFYLGLPLRDVEGHDGDLQDEGIHFLVTLKY